MIDFDVSKIHFDCHCYTILYCITIFFILLKIKTVSLFSFSTLTEVRKNDS